MELLNSPVASGPTDARMDGCSDLAIPDKGCSRWLSCSEISTVFLNFNAKFKGGMLKFVLTLDLSEVSTARG
jgi:hypothetical protein